MRKIALLNSKKFAIVDDVDFETVSEFNWSIDSYGYVVHQKTISGKRRSYKMHHLILPRDARRVVDHINLNKLDNRRTNLRLCTQQQNIWNRPKLRNNKSGYVGVSYESRKARWRAFISLNGKFLHIGYFTNPAEASSKRERVAKALHGDFYRKTTG